MKKENISDALNNIDFDMIEDVYESTKAKKKKPKSSWIKWGAIAACLCLLVMGGIFGNLFHSPDTPDIPQKSIISYFVITGEATELGLADSCFNSAPAHQDEGLGVGMPLFHFSITPSDLKNNEAIYNRFDISVSYNGSYVKNNDEHISVTYLIPMQNSSEPWSYSITGWFTEPTDILINVVEKDSREIMETITVNVKYLADKQEYELEVTNLTTKFFEQKEAVDANNCLMSYFFSRGYVTNYPEWFGGCYIEENKLYIKLVSPSDEEMKNISQILAPFDNTKHDGVYPIITFTMPAKDSVLYTTMNGNIGFQSTFSRAGSGRDPDIWNNALNASKLNDNNPWNLPIYKFDTLSELEKFKSDFGGESGFNYGWDEVPSLNDATKHYDEAFFDRYTLMLVCVEAGSGSYRFGFKNITIADNYFCVNIEQTNNPQGGTDDMAAWFITVAVPDSMFANYTEIDATLDRYSVLDLPGANLEFWIAENVDRVDFSKHQIKYGMMGGTEYYGTGYVPTVDEYGQQVDPEHCVIYTVTSYPDYSDKEQHITGIYITDPVISFYGISLNASFDDFERLITQWGFQITDSNENSRTAQKGKYSITFTKEWIRIRVEVENKDGIIF